MRVIWGRSNSSNVMKLLWFCEETGIAFERRDAGGAFGVVGEAPYKAHNPMSLVPMLEEADGWTLWESNSILRYLASTHPQGTALWPVEPRRRAGIERWMDWQLAHLTPPMTVIFFTYVRTPEAERDWPATQAALARAAAMWRVVDGHLAGGDFLEGGFSLADIALGIFAHRWFNLPVERPDLPRLRGWYERLLARPAYARHVALPMS
ncbi:glutathione S-transferase family protein [Teichococcus vastitatis]|jgi:glutathione S-transferase|uniref:Glutathione S-transferase N-terminal domain-containing protein n=1 Tax=Teichococcus vastitatis TaxID=2307076 RepID=A0ABS9W4F9_9PROT|nr:glutathione S-transferase C-terminal domain-containing protein [Pseudoroseomonas vastitatis]MCI0754171.1 glutathione S-transferase N-terminal domain-containing protein [Pseudoroseomonas vastitatis]